MLFPQEADSSSPERSAAPPPSGQSPILKYVLLAVVAVYVIATLYLLYDLRTRLTAMEKKQQTHGNRAG